MRKIYSLLLAILFAAVAQSQNVAVTGADPATNAASPFATLSDAFVSINATAQTGNSIVITIIGNTTEPAAGAVLNAGVWTSISIQPSGGAARSITGAVTAGSPLINFNGADNVTIDGLNTGGNSLTIANTTASGTSNTSTIRFIGGATNNTITNCSLQGSFSAAVGTNGGVVFFSTDALTANGNDNNTISNCNIGPAGANLSTKGIYMNGSTTTTAINNSGNVFNNNNIFDYFGAAVSSAGVYITSGNTDNNITNNRFYQTATRTQTTGAQHSAIWITNTSGNNFQITGNTIGFASSAGSGTYTFAGVSSSSVLIPVFLSVGTTTATSVQGNTIKAIAMSGAVSGTSSSASFRGIYVSGGLTTIGDVSGNTIGDMSSTGSITFTSSSTSAADVIGIFNFGSSNWTTNNNNIGGITVSNSSTGAANLYGIRCNTGSTVTWTCNNNTVGGSVANSMNSTSTATGTIVNGILNSNPIGTFTGNTIRNMTVAGGTGTTTTASMAGIVITSSTPSHTVSQNTIFNLSNTNATAATVVTGIQFTGGSANVVERNFIHSLTSATNSTSAEVNGIRVAGGTTNYRNNMIALGAGISNAIGTGVTGGVSGINAPLGTDNFFHNSVYIGGAPTAGVGPSFAFNSTQTVNTRSFRDNIFVNARSNSGATGKNYIVRVGGSAPNPGGLTINNNLYYANGTGAVFGFFNSLDVVNLSAWKTAVGQDAASIEADPQYNNPTAATPDLHIHPTNPTPIEAGGADVGVTDDFDGQTRAGLTPVDIGADAGNFVGGDLVAPSISYTPLVFTCATGDRTLAGVIITDASGVPTAGALQPRIYFRKNAGTWFSAQGTLASGSGTNGTWDFTIVAASMGGLVAGDAIQYYVIAQDVAAIPNIVANPGVGLVAIDVNTVTTPPTTPNGYTIGATLSGSYNVGTGQTYTTIGAAITAYNTSCLGGPVTFLLTDASYTGETLPLTITANPDASSTNTLTIKPTLPGTTITGSSASAVFILSGADYVTINGSTGATVNSICPLVTASRDLTISNTNTGTSSAVVWLQTTGADAATNNAIRNCNIVGNSNTTTLVGIGSGSATISNTSLGTGNNNNTFENNNIRAVQLGIYSQGASAANKNTGNTINQNLLNTNSGAAQNIRIAGIFVGFENNITISGNTIGSAGIGSGADGFGIAAGSTAIGTTTFTGNEVINATITNNRIDSIRGASTFSVSGIYIVTATNAGTNLIANNTLTNMGINGTSGDFGSGIFVGGGAVTTNIYFNSVSMSGTFTSGNQPNFALAIGGADPVVRIRNNALSATAVNGGGTGLGIGAYAIGYGYSTFANLVVDNNDYYTAGAEAKFAKTGSLATGSGTDVANLAALQTATAQDAASISVNPLFNNLSNNQPQLGSPLVGAGVPSGSITADILCNVRSVTTPTIGAYEVAADAAAPVITYTLLNTDCTTGNRLLNGVTITDASGVPTAGALQPRVYYRKNAGAWFSSQGTLASGSATNGTWDFTIIAADMGGLTGGDVIQYYVIAQDVAAIPNIASNPSIGLVATDVNTVTTAPTTPNSVSVGVTLNGTYTVGAGGNFTTLTAAVAAYNNGCVTGPVIFDLTDASYSGGETFPISINLNATASAINTLTIRPTGTASISGSATSIITFNGARFVTIDGRIGSTGSTHSLTITNTNTTAPAVIFINDATSDAIVYTDLKSDNTSTTSGVVLFSTTTGVNGNDNNTIDNCNIGPNAATPANGIVSIGTTTTAAQNNSGNTVSNNNIFDIFSATSDCNGVQLGAGSDAWTIQGNSFYQTASRTFTTSGSVYGAILVSNSSGNGFIISGNYIGGSAALCAGSPTTILGNGVLRAIRLTVGTTAATSLQGNTIQNISLTTSSTSTSQSAISILTGNVNCGTVTGNTIGSQSADASTAPSIDVSISGSAAIFSAILAGTGTPGALNISNNTVGGIRIANTGAPATGTSARGIGVQGAPTSLTVSNNTVGSTITANSFVTSTTSSLLGIFLSTTNAGSTISGNTVANLRHTSTTTGSQVIGLLEQGSSGGSYITTGNTVRNLTSSAPNVGTSGSASVIGISHTAATTAGQTVSQNTVYALSNTDAAAATNLTGIHYAGPTSGTNVVSRNFVYGLTVATTSATADIRGISFTSGLASVQNNMIAIGEGVTNGNTIHGLYELISSTGSSVYFNSVYIGGSGVGTQTGNTYAFRSDQTTNTRTFQNNIFMNARSNATTGGKHYAVRVAGTTPNPAGLVLNNNDYFVSGTGGVFGFFNSADVASLAAWQTAVGQDALSLNVDPLYIAPTASTPDLHITSGTTTLESAAAAVAGITVDFDNQTRPGAPSGSNSGAGPDIGADEFDGINPNLCSGTPAQGGTATASSPVVCAGGNITFTLTAPFTTGPGISYQWQTSPAGAGTWSNVVGAVSTVASFPITGNTDVRCLVICVPSGLNTPSTTVTVNGVNCQFNVTRTTGITYTSIAGTGTSMSGWRNTATNTDDNLSTSQPIGFAFPYKGAVYNNFSVSTNGYLTFNVGTAATGSGSGAYGWSNGVFTSTTGTLNALAPFYDDLVCQGNPGTAAGLANGIKYELSGTPGSQVLTVEWIGMETFNNAGPNLNFQVKLYEANGQIDYNYGTFEGFNGTADFGYSYSLGVNAAVITATPTVAELQTQQVENVQNFLNTANNALGRMPECNTRYSFIPGTYGGAGAGPGVPANDEPTAAQTLAVNGSPCTSLCGTYYTSSQATASAGITVCGAGTPGTPDDDVWFSFTATTSQQNITVRGGSGYNAVVQLFSDQGITSIACVNATGAGLTEVINATGLTPSSVYYVRVYHAGTGSSQAPTAGTTTTAAGMPDFSICINEVVPPPANDDPCGAVPLTVSGTCTPYSDNSLPSNTSFLTATNTTVFGVITPTCTGAGTVNDVWFSFVAPASGTANIDVAPVSGVNPAIQLYSSTGTCPSTLVLTPTGCVNGGGTGVTEQTIASALTPGATYYIRVYQHPSGIGGAPVSNSQFSICVYAPLPSCPATFTPANASNACQSANATTLTWTAGANATGYDVYFDPGAGPATTLASSNQAGLTYNAGILTPGVYSWRIEPRNANGVTVCSNLTFTVVAPPSINITPAGPINLCAPSGSQLLSLGSTSAASPTYQWRNGGVPIAGQTGTTYTATATGLYALTVTDGVTGCSTTSNAVVVTLNPQPTVSISPAAATTCPGVGVALTATASAGSFANIKITEVTLFRTGTGQTSPYPAYITGSDLVEISNISASPIDVSGLTFADYASSSSTASHPYTIPASTIIPANGVLVLNLGTGTDDAPNRYFNTGGSNDSWFSGSLVGVVLKSGSTVIDAVGLNSGYVFDAGTGVTAGDWSGFAPSASTFAGTIRSAATDGNTGADWIQSDGPPDQTIGTYNGGYTPTPTTVTYLWTPATGLFTDALLTIPYTNQDIATVYAAPAATTTYNVLVTTAAGCFNNANVIVTVLPANTLEWTGAVNTDWNNAGNWTCGTIPTTTSNVIVKSGVPNYPVVNLNVEIRSLTITPGATVTVATGFDLKLNGN